MNSPEDEIPLPSEGVLSDEETVRQLRADSVRQYTERIKQLEQQLSEVISLKDDAMRHLQPVLDNNDSLQERIEQLERELAEAKKTIEWETKMNRGVVDWKLAYEQLVRELPLDQRKLLKERDELEKQVHQHQLCNEKILQLQTQRDQVLHLLQGGSSLAEADVIKSGLGVGVLSEQRHHEYMRCKAERERDEALKLLATRVEASRLDEAMSALERQCANYLELHNAVIGEGCHTAEVHDIVAIAKRHRQSWEEHQ